MPRLSGSSPCFEDHVLRHPHLDADQKIRVLGERHGAGFHLRVVDIVELGDREGGQAVVGDVDEGIDPCARLRHDIAAQRGEVVDPGVACRHHRGGSLELHQFVGGNADRRAIRIDVAMQVDQAGRHQFARRIDGLQRALGRNLRLDRLDHAPADADVALAPQRLAGIEHVAALDHEIEFVRGTHRRLGGGCQTPRHHGSGRSRKRKKIAA